MTDETGQARARVVARYGELARAATAGAHVADCGPGTVAEGCFSAAAYDDVTGLPAAAVRASLGCGNPLAVAAPRPGETVLDLGSGGGIDVLLSARRVSPGGRAYGLDAAPQMIDLARASAAAAGAGNAEFLRGNEVDTASPIGPVRRVHGGCSARIRRHQIVPT